MPPTRTVLLVEDDAHQARLVTDLLSRIAVRIDLVVVTTLREATSRLADQPFDIVLLDLNLPDSEGPATVQRLLADHPDARVVVLTGHPDLTWAAASLDSGAVGYLTKESLTAADLTAAFQLD